MVIRIWGNVLDLNWEPLTFAAKLETGGKRQEAGGRKKEPEEVFLQIGDARSQPAMKIKYGSNSDSYFEKLIINLLRAGSPLSLMHILGIY
ncbi:hypothetical protein [Microcoleus sp. Pol11C2]|uniref:hypothetical protein n=1 Tax=Microcoleus sp. Pol11C2 TaxID=3055389 RepID=UPI002FCEDA43